MFMILLNICTNSGVLTVFLIMKYLFTIICILLPIILMYRVLAPMFKVVISGKKITDELAGIFKSFIAALIVFLLPGLIHYAFTNLIPLNSMFSECYNNATYDTVVKYRELEEKERKAKQEEYIKESNEAIENANKEEQEYNDQLQDIRDEFDNDTDDSANNGSNTNDNGGSSNGGSGPSSGDTVLLPATMNIIIGDSRTVGMCASITGDWTYCQYGNGGPKYNGNDIYIAQGSMGYSWFSSTAISAVNNILAANPGTTFNIYSLMGVNFLLSDINKYIPKYNSLAVNEWQGHNLILVSVNPVDEVMEAKHGYSTKNVDIISFNTQLKNGTSGVQNIKYCDTYNSILPNLSTSDGLHYTSSTYKAIYNSMMSCGS